MRRAVMVVAALAILAGGFYGGWWLAQHSIEEAVDVEDPLPTTVAVRYGTIQTVVAASVTERFDPIGTVVFAAGTITALPAIETVVAEGDIVAEIDLEPVFAFEGSRPMFRELKVKSEGLDVLQLEEGLVRLGYDPGDVDELFTRSTLAAWNDFQNERGHSATARSVGVGDVAFVPALPALLAERTGLVGGSAGGTTLSFVTPVPTIIISLSRAQADDVETGAEVELIGGPEPLIGSVAQLVRKGTEVEAIVHLPADPEPGNGPMRAVIRSAPVGPGPIVPLSAVHTASDGSTYVLVLDRNTRGSTHVDVAITATNRTEVLVDGDIDEGQDVLIGAP